MSKRLLKRNKRIRSKFILSTFILLLSACHSNLLLATPVIDLPPMVSQSFSQQYPNTKMKAVKEENDKFIIIFTSNKRHCEASFSKDGKWLQTITRIKYTSQLPLNIRNAFYNSPYSSWYINSIRKCELPNESSYSFEINNGNLLDSDHRDNFLQTRWLSIDDNGAVKIFEKQ